MCVEHIGTGWRYVRSALTLSPNDVRVYVCLAVQVRHVDAWHGGRNGPEHQHNTH